MAKKGVSKFIALAVFSGLVAAGVSYFLKYKSFHNELEEEFHDFEHNNHNSDTEKQDNDSKRDYVPLQTESHPTGDLKQAWEDTKEFVMDSAEQIAGEFEKEFKENVKPAMEGMDETFTTIIEEEV